MTPLETLTAACEEFRDNVLNERNQLAEACLNNDQTNAVLREFDNTIGAVLTEANQPT